MKTFMSNIAASIRKFFSRIAKYINEFIHSKQTRLACKIKWKKVMFGMKFTDGLLFKIIIYGLLIIFGFIFLYPILSMIATSVQGVADLADTSVTWIPSQLEFSNYKEAIERLDYLSTFGKTIIIVLVPSLINTLVGCLTAYGFSKFKFPLKKPLFAIMLATFIIPKKLTGIPQYAWFSQIGLLGSLWTYILPSTFGQGLYSALYILILYSTFNMIPKQLEESAKLDGANSLQIFFKIALPLVIPTMITVFLFSFVWYWNDASTAALYLGQQGSGNWLTLLVKLNQYQSEINAITNGGQGVQALLYQGIRMAATLLCIVPLLILYFALQRYFVESVENSGITGE